MRSDQQPRSVAWGRPGWEDDPAVTPWTGYPPLLGDATADACVIGLGGSGLAAIEDLTMRGLQVIGLDAGRVAGAAAGRNGGFLSCGGAMPLTNPTIPRDLLVDLYHATWQEQQRLADLLGPDIVRRTGALEIAGLPGTPLDETEEAAAQDELVRLAAERDALISIGVQAEDYDGELGRGYFTPDTAMMNPLRRAFGLASALPAQARLHEYSRVTGVRSGVVTTDRGTVRAGVIVVAVDGKLDVLLPMLAPLVRTMRLQMLCTAPITAGRLPCGAAFRSGYEWAQQDPAGRLLIGGGRDRFLTDETTTDDQPTAPVQHWIDQAAERVAGEPVSVTHRWAASVGYRAHAGSGRTTDGRPLCLQVDDGVVACGGYSGSGNLVGPVAARAAVAVACDGTQPPGYLRSTF